ncbi:MAG: SurA N-terminal domain-containing protein [Deltaproteobacteria bacterium]|nr:SurA N-terminal domain-containing protein [Deltaproteobacteria bacterium]
MLTLCLLALAASDAPPPGTVVDRVVAVVDKEVITYGELLCEARVAFVLRADARAASETFSAELLRSFLEYLVDQVVIAAQARRVGGLDVKSDEVEREVDRFQGRFSSSDAYRAFMRRFDISDTVLRDILRRDLKNERYIDERRRAWRATADDAQASADPEQRAALARWVKELRGGVELRLWSLDGELELQ